MYIAKAIVLPGEDSHGNAVCPFCGQSLLLVQRIIFSREKKIEKINVEQYDDDYFFQPVVNSESGSQEKIEEPVELLESRIDCSNLNCEYFIDSTFVDASIYD